MGATLLAAAKRDTAIKTSTLRKEKRVPGVFYTSGKPGTHISLAYEELRKAHIAAGSNTLIDLDIDGKVEKVLIQELQLDPVMDTMIHVDFYGVKMKEKIDTAIPLAIVGESPAVKNDGGIMEISLTDVAIRCLPGDLVHEIEVDVSGLVNLGDSLHLSDLVLPKGMELIQEDILTIVSIQAPKEEVEDDGTMEMPTLVGEEEGEKDGEEEAKE